MAMARPGLIVMAIIAVAVGFTSYGALAGGSNLFTSDSAADVERVASIMDRA